MSAVRGEGRMLNVDGGISGEGRDRAEHRAPGNSECPCFPALFFLEAVVAC